MLMAGVECMIETLKHNRELWDLFTRYEEYTPSMLDQYGRFPYYLSNNRNILEPKVSTFLIENDMNVEYPENKKFAVCLTHNIDNVYYSKSVLYTMCGVVKSLIHGQAKNACKMPFHKINKRWNPWWNFEDIMALEDMYGAKSSFYFLTLDEDNLDFNFDIEDLEHEIGTIADNG